LRNIDSFLAKDKKWVHLSFKGISDQVSYHKRIEFPFTKVQIARFLYVGKVFRQSLHQKEISLDLAGGKAVV
jgi:hypothetical protein